MRSVMGRVRVHMKLALGVVRITTDPLANILRGVVEKVMGEADNAIQNMLNGLTLST